MRTSLVFISMVFFVACKKEESKFIDSTRPNYYGKWKLFCKEEFFLDGGSGYRLNCEDTSKPDFDHYTFTKDDSLFHDIYHVYNTGPYPIVSFTERSGVKFYSKMYFGNILKNDVLEYFQMTPSGIRINNNRRQVFVKEDSMVLKADSLLINYGSPNPSYYSINEYFVRIKE